MVEELRAHAPEICHKASITRPLLEETLNRLLQNVQLAPLSSYQNRLHEAMQLTRDESDAPLAALALVRSPSTLITYNKKHFNSRGLTRQHVQVLTPVEALRELR
jgi:predicted nucleic acid-binding protein